MQICEFDMDAIFAIFLCINVVKYFLLIDPTDNRNISSDRYRIQSDISLYPFHLSRTLHLRNQAL